MESGAAETQNGLVPCVQRPASAQKAMPGTPAASHMAEAKTTMTDIISLALVSLCVPMNCQPHFTIADPRLPVRQLLNDWLWLHMQVLVTGETLAVSSQTLLFCKLAPGLPGQNIASSHVSASTLHLL